MSNLYKILIGVSLFAVFIFNTANVFAETINFSNPLVENDLIGVAKNITDFMLKIGAPLAAIMILYGSYNFMTAGDDPAKVKTAKMIIVWTVVGIILLAIASSVFGLLGELIAT